MEERLIKAIDCIGHAVSDLTECAVREQNEADQKELAHILFLLAQAKKKTVDYHHHKIHG